MMNKSCLVSVIIPNYNHSDYLDDRLNSVLNQTYDNIEIIVLDDCSTDNSLLVLEKYKEVPRISHIIVNKKNSGSPFAQWKKGLEFVKGDLVWIAESDDACSNTFLEELVRFYMKNNLVMAFSLSRKMNLNSSLGDVVQNELSHDLLMTGHDYITKYLCLITNASSAIFSRACAQKIDNNYFDYKGAGDWLFWAGIASQGNVGVLAKPLNYYRVHDKNTTLKMFRDGRDFYELKKIFYYLYDKGLWSKWIFFKNSAQMVYNIKYIFKFDNERIRTSLLREWNGTSIINQGYCLYISGCRFINNLRKRK